jgi:hypothetical protein
LLIRSEGFHFTWRNAEEEDGRGFPKVICYVKIDVRSTKQDAAIVAGVLPQAKLHAWIQCLDPWRGRSQIRFADLLLEFCTSCKNSMPGSTVGALRGLDGRGDTGYISNWRLAMDISYSFFQGDKFLIGYIDGFPQYPTQGKNIEDLEKHLLEIHR